MQSVALVKLTSLGAYLPSPPANGISIGAFRLHVYGLLIAAGIAAAIWLAQKRWSAIGGQPGTMSTLALWGVPGGLIGARVYSLATSWNIDTNGGHVIQAFEVWRGGLGIWGGVVGGIGLGYLGVRRAGMSLAPLLDCVAPAFALAQAIGRWGNYFNQELYGWRSGLPWAVKIDNPPGYPPGTTFQPTFLYESIWDLLVCLAVIRIERRFRVRRGYLIAVYAALYTFGRFFTERMRIDAAHTFLGMRLNDWTSILVFVVAAAVVLLKGRAKEGEERAGDPLPPGSVTGFARSATAGGAEEGAGLAGAPSGQGHGQGAGSGSGPGRGALPT